MTIIGRPNAGKSTLINSLVGEKVAIVSWRPQTTRNKITGILNGDDFQAVFIDTPGLHDAKNKLSDFMMKSVETALSDVDCLLYVSDAVRGVSTEDLAYLENAAKKTSVVVAVNKIDCIAKETLFPELEKLNRVLGIKAVVPVSAKRGDNLDVLQEEIKKLLPEGVKYYPDDMLTDKSMKFMCSEIIREKALTLLDKEVPYGLCVVVNRFEKRDEKDLFDIDADIVCERKTHKGIIIGKQGAMLKRIATEARKDMEELLESKVFLTLYVKVKEDWRDSEYLTSVFGYDKKEI